MCFRAGNKRRTIFGAAPLKAIHMDDIKDQVAMSIYIAIKRSPKSMRRSLCEPLPLKNDEAARKFTAHIMDALKGYDIRKIIDYGAGDAITPTNKL